MKRRGFLRAVAAAGAAPIAGAAQPATPRADHAAERAVTVRPRVSQGPFRSFWSAGPGWGSFSYGAGQGRPNLVLSVVEGRLPVRSVAVRAGGAGTASAKLGGEVVRVQSKDDRAGRTLAFSDDIVVAPGKDLTILL